MFYFSSDYREAKASFVTAAKGAGARLNQLKIQPTGPQGEELSVDLAVFGDLNSPKILLHTSGLHGVEGFAGSAIQLAAVSEKIEIPSDVNLIFIHILNPYGMAWLRRVNENNVDLNRNYLPPGEPYAGCDPAYGKLDKFLNDAGRADWFWPLLLYNLGRVGFRALKNAIVLGQYDFPAGLFFGGDVLQESLGLYSSWLKKNILAPRYLLALDVHTGLGGFGDEVLFCHTNYLVPKIGKKMTALTDRIGYKVRGGLETLTNDAFPNAKWVHLTEEFGTYSMARVLKTLREENLYARDQHRVGEPSIRLKKIMNPDNKAWQEAAVAKGLETLSRSLQWLAAQ